MTTRFGIMLIGLPGSGKNTFIDQKLSSTEFMPISRDDIREELGYCQKGEKYAGNREEEQRVTDIFNERLELALETNHIPVINNTNLKLRYREILKRDVAHYNVRWIYIYIKTNSLEENKRRRRNQIDENVLDNMFSKFDIPKENECEKLITYIAENGCFTKTK